MATNINGDEVSDPGNSTEAGASPHNSSEELRKAASAKQWRTVLSLLNEHTCADKEAVKHVVLMAASNGAWSLMVKIFKNNLDLCQTVYKCLHETLSANHKLRFFTTVFKWASTKQDVKIASNVFQCAILARSVRSKVAMDIVYHIGKRPVPQFPRCRFDQSYLFFKAVEDFLCQQLPRDQLLVFISCLKEDGRDSCMYMALLLSAIIGDWDFVNRCLTTKSPQFYAGTKHVLCLAWENDALECAARVLQNTASKIWWLGPYLRLRDRRHAQLFSSHPASSFNKQKMATFLDVCQNMKLYDAAMTVCLLMKNMSGLLRIWRHVIAEGQSDRRWGNTVGELTKVVLEWAGFRLAIKMMSHCEEHEQGICLDAIHDHMILSQISDQKIRALTRTLISQRLEKSSLWSTLATIIVNCHSSSLLQYFFAKQTNNFSPADFYFGDGSLLCFIINEIQEQTEAFEYLRLHSFGRRLQRYANELKDARAMLRVCIETGVATHQIQPILTAGLAGPFPLTLAVKAHLLDEARLLYNAGATTNAELYSLCTNQQLRSNLEQKGEGDFLQFLDSAASNPRRLQDLCCLTVSHCIGCRADRKQRALSLELPEFLIPEILLFDVLYPNGNPWPA